VTTENSSAKAVHQSPGAAPFRASPEASSSRRTVTSSELLAGRNELNIEHNGELYLLRRTSNGKLILTK